MKRFVGGTLEDFERFFVGDSEVYLEEAVYPSCCLAKSGPLRFRRARAGALILDVKRCNVEPSGDFRLDMLFSTGSCPFSDAVDLAQFWNGPLAEAFGLPRGPIPERAGQLPIGEPPETIAKPRTRKARTPVKNKRAPTSSALAARLELVVTGQAPALMSIASLIATQFAKRNPARPATGLLLGPTGVGKTSTVEALPHALSECGWNGAFVHRIDCNELTDDYDVHRFLGSAPGLVGYTKTPPLVAAMQKPGCVVLLDEIDKAHPSVQEALYALLDSGRVMAPDGTAVRAPATTILMTSAAGANELGSRLHQIEPSNNRSVERIARVHLREEGWPNELIGRIDAIAVYHELEEDARRGAATQAIQRLGEEYGFDVVVIPPVLADVVLDLAADAGAGARGLYYGARQLLAEPFAGAAEAEFGARVQLRTGPPPSVAPADPA